MRARGSMDIVRITLIVVGVVCSILIVWQLRSFILMVFAAVLFAVIFQAAAAPVSRWTKLPHGVSLTLAVALLLAAVGFILLLFGSQFSVQMQSLFSQLPAAWSLFKTRTGLLDLDRQILVQLQEMAPNGGAVLSAVGSLLGGIGAALSGLLLSLVAGIYIAAQPQRYLDGLVASFPYRHRANVREALIAAGTALRKWLVGQLVAMTLVGMLAGVGLWLLDVPSPLALGLIAGLLEFVPVAGPFASAVPAILLALAAGWEKAAMVALLYFGIQQIEGNLITPLVQQQSVDLPPALTLFALVAFGLLFGLLGVLLAAPLTVCLYVWVTKLYVPDKVASSTA